MSPGPETRPLASSCRKGTGKLSLFTGMSQVTRATKATRMSGLSNKRVGLEKRGGSGPRQTLHHPCRRDAGGTGDDLACSACF